MCYFYPSFYNICLFVDAAVLTLTFFFVLFGLNQMEVQ